MNRYNQISIDAIIYNNDITDLVEFCNRTGLNFDECSQNGYYADCEVLGTYLNFVQGTHINPPEGGYCEDILILVNGEKVTDLIDSLVIEGLNDKLCDARPTKDDFI